MIQFKSSALLSIGQLLGMVSNEAIFWQFPPLSVAIEYDAFGKNPRVKEVKPDTEAARNQILGQVVVDAWKRFLETQLIDGCMQLDLKLSRIAAIRTIAVLESGKMTYGQFCTEVKDLTQRLVDELEDKITLQVDSRHSQSCGNPKAFGNQVFTSFPSANDDIVEAATCLALDRGTACVMHLSRAVEVGLKAIAKMLGLPDRNNWGRHLNDIESELRKRYRVSGARTPEEAFLSEAAIQIGHIKVAWRNPSMHVDRNYSPERAEEIFTAIGAFMRHLATGLSEEPC